MVGGCFRKEGGLKNNVISAKYLKGKDLRQEKDCPNLDINNWCCLLILFLLLSLETIPLNSLISSCWCLIAGLTQETQF